MYIKKPTHLLKKITNTPLDYKISEEIIRWGGKNVLCFSAKVTNPVVREKVLLWVLNTTITINNCFNIYYGKIIIGRRELR